jgi:hypothetical protein
VFGEGAVLESLLVRELNEPLKTRHLSPEENQLPPWPSTKLIYICEWRELKNLSGLTLLNSVPRLSPEDTLIG